MAPGFETWGLAGITAFLVFHFVTEKARQTQTVDKLRNVIQRNTVVVTAIAKHFDIDVPHWEESP